MELCGCVAELSFRVGEYCGGIPESQVERSNVSADDSVGAAVRVVRRKLSPKPPPLQSAID
jgi:hypothetical protein